MTSCTGSFNENVSSKEIKFNILKDKHFSTTRKMKYKSRSNPKINAKIKEDIHKDNLGLFKFEKSKKSNKCDILNNKNKYNIIKNHEKNDKHKDDFNVKEKLKDYNSEVEKINKIEDDCDIIECEDDFDCENLIDLIKNVDIHNNKRNDYFYDKKNVLKKNDKKEKEIIGNNELLNDSYINKDLNMELSVSKNIINGSEIQSSTIFENLVNNEKSMEKINDFEKIKDDIIQIKNNKKEKSIDNDDEKQINCYNNKNIYFNKNNKEISSKNEETKYIFSSEISEKRDDTNLIENNNINIIKENRNVQNNEFQNCKIDNNLNININNNNNLNNINNINSINNISTINNNSELNNNNYIDVSNNMTYFLSLEKSHRRPVTSIIEKNIFSLKKSSYESNNISYNKETYNNYNYNSGINTFKWKLLPKHKYNTHICKSCSNNQSLSLNEDNQKNSQLTTLGTANKNINNNLKNEITFEENNNLVFTEFKKQKEEQDKKIKNLQDKISSLYKILKEEKSKEFQKDQKILKLEGYMARNTDVKITKNDKKLKLYKNKNNQYKKALNDIKFVESQKDTKIKKLEEQLENLKKNNKINKQLLIKKNNLIKNLIDSKSKQDELIKKYEILNFQNNSTKGIKKINYFENTEKKANNLSTHKTSFSVSMKNNSCKKLNKSLTLKNRSNSLNKNVKKYKNCSNQKINNTNFKSSNLRKEINTKNISNFTELLNMERNNFLKDNSKINKKSNRNINIKTEKKNINCNANSTNNKSSFDEKNINYNNYCNSLCNKSKNKYSNKISLNRIKMYKYNKYKNSPTNITNQILNKDLTKKEPLYEKNNYKKKTFSFKKSKKLVKNNEVDLKEMYLKAGNVKNEENNIIKEINIINNNNDMKIYPCDNIFYRNNNNNKTNITNSNNNTTITNNITNLSMSPIILTRFHNIENLSIDEKLNLSGNINNNNLSNFNNYLKSLTNDEIEKEQRETNKIYKKLWDEGFLRYEEMCKIKLDDKNKGKKENNLEKKDDFWKLNFGMANELIEININKNDFMLDVKNKFLNNFFEKKIYGDNEKKYINENILFLNKEGIIDINRKVNENNINNNEIIIPVLKDIT